ncbi:flagellar motor switch protein FliG [Rhodovulum sulfidophilum]|nr:flagellar motor switch protein FliG [Rhodovulum sulfidophilum]
MIKKTETHVQSFGAPIAPHGLTSRQKAAIIVRLVLNEGIDLPLHSLPASVQTDLADEIANMRYIDGNTLQGVIEEFLMEIEQFGLSFPGGIDEAMRLLGDHLSPEAAAAIRARFGSGRSGDPWATLSELPPDRMTELLLAESPEIAAVALSKLPSPIAATILGRMPGPEARRIAFAISRTAEVPPAAVTRIGRALADRINSAPEPAFELAPETRMGAILDVAPAATREDVLQGLRETDAELAEKVRQAVFTFADIPDRLDERDVPALTRAIEQTKLITAMAGADGRTGPAVEYILANMSQRMANQIRDEINERDAPGAEEAEAAMSEVIGAIRNMEAAGEIKLRKPSKTA